MTGDARFIEAFKEQANRLLAALELDEHGLIWTQDLYGRRQRWLGPVHGFAGNMLPLVRGCEWLTPEQRAVVADAMPGVDGCADPRISGAECLRWRDDSTAWKHVGGTACRRLLDR